MEETLPDVSNNEPNGGDYRGYIEVKPWTRFWARTLDYIIFVSLPMKMMGIEYSNYANALYVLGNVSEAEKAYDKSLEVKRVSG